MYHDLANQMKDIKLFKNDGVNPPPPFYLSRGCVLLSRNGSLFLLPSFVSLSRGGVELRKGFGIESGCLTEKQKELN